MNKSTEEILSKPLKFYINNLIGKFGTPNLSKPVIFFGAGKMAEIYYENCKKNNITVLGVFDNDPVKHGKIFVKKLKVMSPNYLYKYSKETQIIVTSISDEEIIGQLKIFGFLKVWSHAFASTVFPNIFYNPYWLNDIDKIIKNKQKVIKSYSLLSDALSRKTFNAILKYRLFLEKKDLSRLTQPINNEYLEEDIIKVTKSEIFIDCGAYNGDTTKRFIKFTKDKYKSIIDFEPDSNLFKQLNKYVDRLNDKRIVTYPYGLGKTYSTLRFTNDGTLGSRIANKGKHLVKVVNLDKFLDIEPTFIKLDIEGAELDALKGAKKIISKFRPKITLSLYHKTEDLWEIPLFLKKFNRDYRFYLRHYSPFLYDTICYAV